MTINKIIIKDLEHRFRRLLPNELKTYLLIKYAREPFPYEFSEQDLYTNIQNDINSYDAGELDVTIKSLGERFREECQHLQKLYSDKCCELRRTEKYVRELEHILMKHGLESSKMDRQQTDF